MMPLVNPHDICEHSFEQVNEEGYGKKKIKNSRAKVHISD